MLSSEVTSVDMMSAMRPDTRQVTRLDGLEVGGVR